VVTDVIWRGQTVPGEQIGVTIFGETSPVFVGLAVADSRGTAGDTHHLSGGFVFEPGMRLFTSGFSQVSVLPLILYGYVVPSA
jgi:hypothetical protein